MRRTHMRWFSVKALVWCAVGVLLASSCSSGSSGGPAVVAPAGLRTAADAHQAATRACRAALGEDVASAVATTVGDVRRWGIGPYPEDYPAASAFPGESDTAFAAWCWVGTPPEFASWGVDEHGVKVEFGSVGHGPGDMSVPSGPIGIGS